MHTPDRWLILKITKNEESIYKVLAGWSGSYLEGQSWRINSGIKKVTEVDGYYLFEGDSGSVYKCHPKSYGANMIMSGILNSVTKQKDYDVIVVDEKEVKNVLVEAKLF